MRAVGDFLIEYSYIFDDTHRVDFRVELDDEVCAEVPGQAYPDWILLDRHRCPECTVPPGSRRTCPAALSLLPVVGAFNTRLSYEDVQLIVVRRGIKMEATIPTQNALRSLIGLLLPLSSCPIMSRLRPMAQMHLPLGTRERTSFRFLGMHLVAQYLRSLEGEQPDWQLKELSVLLAQIRSVNRHMAERLRAVTAEDAAVNGLILLDAFVDSVELCIESELERLKPLFSCYLRCDR